MHVVLNTFKEGISALLVLIFLIFKHIYLQCLLHINDINNYLTFNINERINVSLIYAQIYLTTGLVFTLFYILYTLYRKWKFALD